MKIRLLLPVMIKGHPEAKVGHVIEIPSGEAGALLGMKAAEEVLEENLPPVPPLVETRDPVIEHRDPETAEKPRHKSAAHKRPK